MYLPKECMGSQITENIQKVTHNKDKLGDASFILCRVTRIKEYVIPLIILVTGKFSVFF